MTSILSKIEAAIEAAIEPAAKPAGVVATIAGTSITGAEISAGAASLKAILAAIEAKFANVQADEIAVNDVLALIGEIDPALAPLAPAAKFGEWFIPVVLEAYRTGAVAGAAPYREGPGDGQGLDADRGR